MSSRQDPDKPILRDHVYDGIQEYDQKLPNWWLFTLYIFVVLFVLYWVAHYHLHAIPTDAERLDPIVEEVREKKMEQMLTMLDDDNLLRMSQNESGVAECKTIYTSTCLPCHGPNMGGKSEGAVYIGLSLMDSEWKYGGEPTEIYQMIYDGTPNPEEALARGEIVMPAQGTILGAEKAAKVTAFVLNQSPHVETPASE